MNTNVECFNLVLVSIFNHLQGTRKELTEQLKQASAELQKSKKQHVREQRAEKVSNQIDTPTIVDKDDNHNVDGHDDVEKKEVKHVGLNKATEKIQAALEWYTNLLEELKMKASTVNDDGHEQSAEQDLEQLSVGDSNIMSPKMKLPSEPRVGLTSEEVAIALTSCDTEDARANWKQASTLTSGTALSGPLI